MFLWGDEAFKEPQFFFTADAPANRDVHRLTDDRQGERVLRRAPAVSHDERVAPSVLRRCLGDHQRAAQICGLHPQLWTVHNLCEKKKKKLFQLSER